MGENIDPTWIAWSGRSPLEHKDLQDRWERVRRHYAQLVAYPLRVAYAAEGSAGVGITADAEPRSAWSHFAQDDRHAVASAYVPGGWSRLVPVRHEEAPLALGRSVFADPAAVIGALSPPVALAALDLDSGELIVVNDSIGAARAFTLAAGGLTLWSNRPGALAIFAGVEPVPDQDGWRVLAGAGWPLRGSTPVAGVERLAPATVCRAARSGAVSATATNGAALLVKPNASWRELADPAADGMLSQAREVDALWPERSDVDLSGGRDSRVTAAATIAAGIDARYLTSNATPGEGPVARELMERLDGDRPHRIRRRKAGSATPGTPLLERAANLHLLHDGVRHAQKLRGKMTLPRPRPERAKFSGHGGEIAHAFFYDSPSEILRLRFVPGAGRRKLDRFFGQAHEAILPEAREAANSAVEKVLGEGRELGLRGPVLLDWFYLVDRFAHRSGLATDSERSVLFAAPAVIRASFALTPRERIEGRLHRWLTARFVPEWVAVPYFEETEAARERTKRERLWEVEDDAAVVEEILAAGGAWTDLYDREIAIREWRALRSGTGNRKAETLFEGIVYRATFDLHLERLGRAAGAD